MAILIPDLVFPVTSFVQLVDIAHERAGRPRLAVTSWKRSLERQLELVELGAGRQRSLHVVGLALDLQGPPPALQAMQTAWRAFGLDAVLEAPLPGARTNPVLHIELDGAGLRRIGVRFL